MGLTVKPGDTFAALVGIETYAGGWEALDGPANDAARFAQWLCDEGVPATNIYAFVSMTRDRGDYAFPDGCRLNQPTLGAVSHFVKHVLPTLRGTGLFFLWGGHGIVDDDRERQLFLADATSDVLESVDVPSLLRFLRSTYIKGFEQQWFVIDTCANRFRTASTHRSLARLGLPDLMDARRHSQYVLFSASVGEKSANLTMERRGLFAGEVLETLTSLPRRQWPPDMEAVSRQVDARFAAGGARQSPEYRWYRMGSTEPTLHGSVHPGEAPIAVSAGEDRGVNARDALQAAVSGDRRETVSTSLTDAELDLFFELAVLRDAASSDDIARAVLQREVLDVVTRRVIRTVVDELINGRVDRLALRSLLRLRSFEFIQAEQRCRLLEPIVRDLTASHVGAEVSLRTLLAANRRMPGCAAANLVNLIATIRADVGPLDISGAKLADADFRTIAARGLDLRGCDLSGAAFCDGFNSMLSVAFSPDGRLMATANADGVVRVWRVDDGRQERAFSGHTDWAWAVAFSPVDSLVASSGDDRTVRVWSLDSGAQRYVLEGHSDWVRAVAFSPDGTVLASGSQDGTVRLWDVATGRALRTLIGHQDQIWCVSFNPRTGVLASGSGDGTVCLWDIAATAPTQRWEADGGRVFSVAFSPDGARLATAGDTRDIRVWNAHTGRLEAQLTGHERRVWRAVFDHTGEHIVSSSEDRSVRLWDWRTRQSRTLLSHDDWVRSVAYHPVEAWVATASDDQSVVISRASDGRTIRRWTGWSEPLWAVAFAPNGKAVFAGGRRSVYRWSLDGGLPFEVPVSHHNRVWAVAVSGEAHVGASGGDDEVLRLWSLEDGTERTTLKGHGKPIWCVAFSPRGDLVASGSEDRTARIWSVEHGELVAECAGHTLWVRGATFSPDGSMLATGSDDRTVRLWNPTGELQRVLQGHTGRVWTVAFHPDGDLLASGGDDGIVRIWSSRADRDRIDLAGHGGRIWSAAFSPDGTCLATCSSDRTVRIWDIHTRRVMSILEGHSRWVRGVAFSPDGSTLASASEDGTVRLWDGRSFSPIGILSRTRPYEGMRIAGAHGLTDAQRETLILLGASDEP